MSENNNSSSCMNCGVGMPNVIPYLIKPKFNDGQDPVAPSLSTKSTRA